MDPYATLRFHTLDVFTDTRFGGNPLAVVSGGESLSTAQMQALAREFNLSETVFVLPATRADCLRRLRIFTPAAELPFAGHPTVGAACWLALEELAPAGEDVSFALEEAVGPVPVRLRREAGRPLYAELTAAQPPAFGPAAPDAAALAASLGLTLDELGARGEMPRVAGCGVDFLLVPLRGPECLAGIDVDASALRGLLAGIARGVYVYAHGYEGELRTRMFAPGLGVNEDPATGAAAVALAGALALEARDEGRLEWRIHQGEEMNRPSRLHASAERRDGRVVAVRVGGHAVAVSEGRLIGR